MAGIYINIADPEAPTSVYRPTMTYAQALCQEIQSYSETHGHNETVETIYVGGKPHAVHMDALSTIIETTFVHYDTTTLHEFSIDVEPHAADPGVLQHLQALGVNRINLIARSFFDEDLQTLDCTYRSRDVHEAIETIQATGFKNLGIELYYDINGQPFEYWAANLEKAIHRHISHISLRSHREHTMAGLPHQLACCFFFPELQGVMLDRFSFAMDYIAGAQYDHYLLMEFAQQERQCNHFMLHVYQSNMLGIGPNAHSFWWYGSSQSRAQRWSNVDNIERYIALLKQRELPVEYQSMFSLDNLANEYTMLRIQTPEGINTETLETEYGIDLYSEKLEELAALESENWIEPIRNNRIRLTNKGRLHCFDVIPKLLINV